MAREDCVQGHSVLIYDRGGRRRLSEIVNLQSVTWNRTLSGKSMSTVVLGMKDCEQQLDRIERISARRHEMVIFRGDQRVWEGPLLDLGWFNNRLELYALDVSEYVARRTLSKAWPLETGTPVSEFSSLMTERIRLILEYELATDYTVQTNAGPKLIHAWDSPGLNPPANILPYLEVRHSDTLLTRSATTAFQMYVGDHLNNLAESKLNYVVVGRKLLIWDSAQSIGTTRVLTDQDFYGELKVHDTGADFAAVAHLGTSTTDGEGEPPVGHAGEESDFYGPWAFVGTTEQEEGNTETPTQSELNSQAARYLVGKNPVPVDIEVPDGLRLSDDLTVNHLVPGVVMPVRASMNLKKVQQDFRLTEMQVQENASGETVSVSLSPAGVLEAVA